MQQEIDALGIVITLPQEETEEAPSGEDAGEGAQGEGSQGEGEAAQ